MDTPVTGQTIQPNRDTKFGTTATGYITFDTQYDTYGDTLSDYMKELEAQVMAVAELRERLQAKYPKTK